MAKRFDRKTIRRGLNVFFGFSIASIVVIFLFTDSAETLSALKRIKAPFLLAAVGVAALDSLGGGLRMWVLTRGLSRISFVSCLRASLASISMGAVTPSQAGGGPAMIFMLQRGGLSWGEAMSAGLMSFVVTILFFVVSAAAITVLGVNASVPEGTIRELFRYGLAVFMVLGAVFMVFTTWPALLRGAIRGVFNFASRFRRRHLLRPGSRATALLDLVQEFHDNNVTYFRHRFPALAASIVVTASIFLSKCCIAWFILRGLGVEADIWQVVSVQILILLAVYFFPTPGGAGAAELGAAVLMASIVPATLMPVFVVLWRVVVIYLAVIVGSAVMVHELGQDTIVADRPGKVAVEKKIAVSGEST